jgi:predicted component of type VI protein secretion system
MSDSIDEFFKRLERKLREMEESIRKDVEKLLSESRSEAGTTRIKNIRGGHGATLHYERHGG